MKISLMTELAKMDDVDFRELELNIRTAKTARQLKIDYNCSDEKMMSLLNIKTKARYKKYMNGACDYTIKDWARQEAAYCTLESERINKESKKGKAKMEETAKNMYKVKNEDNVESK